MTLLTLDLIYLELLPRLMAIVNTEMKQVSLCSYAYKMLSVVFLSAEESFSLLLDKHVPSFQLAITLGSYSYSLCTIPISLILMLKNIQSVNSKLLNMAI